jgi:predicted dehydrogenase
MNQPEQNQLDFNRRNFLKGSSLAAMLTMMGGVRLFAQSGAERKVDAPVVGDSVKVAVIGLGPWGREILDQLGRLPKAEVVAICDTYPPMLRRGAARAPGATQTGDYQTILANPEVQAVIVATGSHQHKDIVIAALKAGKHVYCEMPLAHTIEDARAIALAARQAPTLLFQAGLQGRSDPQRQFLLPFIRSGALGRPVMARAHWRKKQSWRQASPNAEYEKASNWRLQQRTSPGLIGEVGVHALDQAGWMFNLAPVAVTGFGSTHLWRDDGRDVPDTVEAIIEFPGGVRMNYSASLATSYDSECELLFGSDATIMMRQDSRETPMAWMFKEVDSPLLGWEVYARKDNFFNETGIFLAAGSSKQDALLEDDAEAVAPVYPTLYYSLNSFLSNSAIVTAAVAEFRASFEDASEAELAGYLETLRIGQTSDRPAASAQDGYIATVVALVANDAANAGNRIEFRSEWFELT